MLFVLFLLQAAVADIPVHCLRHQVAGKWKLHVGPPGPHRSSCGHAMPDSEDKQPSLREALNGTTTEVEFTLSDPATVQKEGATDGNWTMVYDEGFFMNLEEKDYFAFSHFLQSDPKSVQWFQPRVHGKKVYRSVCGKTEMGWYHDKKTDQWGCFYGERTDVKDPDAFHDYLSFLNVVDDAAYLEKMTMEQHETVADKINAMNLGWTASADSRFAGMSLEQLNKRAGNAKYSRRSTRSSFLETKKEDAEFEQTPVKVDAATAKLAATLPEEFNWQKHEERDWLDPVTDQGDCGSCYAVSSTNMLTSRFRVSSNNTLNKTSFSIGFGLYCSDMNQGCNGGYPFLTAMWSQGVGLVSTECAGHYRVGPENQQCSQFLAHAEKTKKIEECIKDEEAAVTDFRYVGGYYGGCSEEAMRVALLDGPLTVAIEPGMDFMYYKGGVFTHVDNDKKSGIAPSDEWVKVDHAVLLVGWGVDKTEKEERKYWLIQNSWGKEWGEDGYVRVARGTNEIGIEFQAMEAHVQKRNSEPIKHFLHEQIHKSEF